MIEGVRGLSRPQLLPEIDLTKTNTASWPRSPKKVYRAFVEPDAKTRWPEPAG